MKEETRNAEVGTGNDEAIANRAADARESFLKLLDSVPAMRWPVNTADGQFAWIGEVKIEAFKAVKEMEQWQRSKADETRELLRIKLARIAALAWRAARDLGVEDEIPF